MSWDFEISLEPECDRPGGSYQYAYVNYIAPVGPPRPMARICRYRGSDRSLIDICIELHGGTIHLDHKLTFSHLGTQDRFAQIHDQRYASLVRTTYLEHQDKRYRVFRYGRTDRSDFLVCDCVPPQQNGANDHPPLIKMEWITEHLLRGTGFRAMDPELSGLIFSLIFAFDCSTSGQLSNSAGPLFLGNAPSIPHPARQDGALTWHFTVRSRCLYDAVSESFYEVTVTQTDPEANGRLLAIFNRKISAYDFYSADLFLPTISFSHSSCFDAALENAPLGRAPGPNGGPEWISIHFDRPFSRSDPRIDFESRSYPVNEIRHSNINEARTRYQLLSCDPADKDGNTHYPVLMEMENTADGELQGCCYGKVSEALYGSFFSLPFIC